MTRTRRRRARMSARILGVVRSRRKQRQPVRIGDGCVVAVRIPGPDRGDRAPERVRILGVEAGDQPVSGDDRRHRHEPRGIGDAQRVIVDEPAERGMCLLDRGLTPEASRQRLFGGAGRARPGADLLHLVVARAQRRLESGGGPTGRNWLGVEAEGPHVRHVGADRRRLRGRIQTPGIGGIGRGVRDRRAEAVVGTQGDQFLATCSPSATPSAFAWPSGIVPSDWT